MDEIKAPESLDGHEQPYIFLAGSIGWGSAEPWRNQIINALSEIPGTILNPRRDDWDSSWVQSIDNQQFREQVEWELEGLERADIAVFYFQPGTLSPISLLEFGICAWEPAVVCCPDGFWRKGNIEVVCNRYHIQLVESLKELETWLWGKFWNEGLAGAA